MFPSANQTHKASVTIPSPDWSRLRGLLSRNLLARFILGSTTLFVGLGTYLSYQTVRQTMLESLKQEALAKVRQGSNEIDGWLATLKTRVEMLANTKVVQSVNWSVAKPYLQAEDKRIQDFLFISLTTAKGWRESTAAHSKGASVRDRQWFQKAMAGQIYVDDPMIARATGVPGVAIAAPIFKDGKSNLPPIGVVHGLIGVEQLKQVINWLQYGDNSHAFALNSEGQAIVHPNPAFMSTVDKPAPSLGDFQQRNYPDC